MKPEIVSAKKMKIAAAIGSGMTLNEACKLAGVSRISVWKWRKNDADFDEIIDFAMDKQTAKIEDMTIQKALDPDPANNILRIFLLKTRWPHLYQDKNNVTIGTNHQIDVSLKSESSSKVALDAIAVLGALRDAGVVVAGKRHSDRLEDSVLPAIADDEASGVSDA